MLTVGSFWERIAALATSIAVARLLARIVCPLVAIAFKWIVIGRYKPGTYRMWVQSLFFFFYILKQASGGQTIISDGGLSTKASGE